MLLVGTTNHHKLEEIIAILAGLPVDVVGAGALPGGAEVVENGISFAENAEIKARECARRAAAMPLGERPRWVIADDSGLCVDALGGAPGVRSARYAGEGATSADNRKKLLAALAAVPRERRQASFVASVACAEVPRSPAVEPGVLFTVEGRCSGGVGFSERGAGGFGYDSLFIDAGSGKTFAELPAAEKHRISHRGRALALFRQRFQGLLAERWRP